MFIPEANLTKEIVKLTQACQVCKLYRRGALSRYQLITTYCILNTLFSFPARRCQTLKPIFNGMYEIVPFNTFGAKVRYTCSPGYVLLGGPERVCQGDGYWSGEAPTCQAEGDCPLINII